MRHSVSRSVLSDRAGQIGEHLLLLALHPLDATGFQRQDFRSARPNEIGEDNEASLVETGHHAIEGEHRLDRQRLSLPRDKLDRWSSVQVSAYAPGTPRFCMPFCGSRIMQRLYVVTHMKDGIGWLADEMERSRNERHRDLIRRIGPPLDCAPTAQFIERGRRGFRGVGKLLTLLVKRPQQRAVIARGR